MNFREFLLHEMPLTSFQTQFNKEPHEKEGYGEIGDKPSLGRQVYHHQDKTHDIEGYFSKKDRTIISHPKTLRKLEEKLSQSKYKFNILMIENSQNNTRDYDLKVQDFILKNKIPTETHITFVKNGTSGHVLTPWMILHTIGHAIDEHTGGKYYPALKRILQNITNTLCNLDPEYIKSLPKHMPIPSSCLRRLGEVFLFKSIQPHMGQDASFHNMSEIYHEFIAEYLWNGDKIRSKTQNPEIIKNIQYLENIIKDMLDECVGHVIYDYLG